MRKRPLALAALAGTVLALLVAGTAAADHPGGGGTPFFATMSGAQEIPGPGAPEGTGTAVLRLNSGQEEICFELAAENLGPTPASAAHIHVINPETGFGPVVVGLAAATTGESAGCVFAPRELIKEIRQNPENYYVNVHTRTFPGGAVRGGLCGPGRGQC